MPAFDLGSGGFGLVLLRGAWDLALLSGVGTLAFLVLVAPRALAGAEPAVAARVLHRLLLLARASLALALAALLAWCVGEAADIAGQPGPATTLVVLRETVFGHVALMQGAAVLAALALGAGGSAVRLRAAALCAAGAAALQAGHGHGLAAADGPTMAAGAVHMVAAGVWLGGLAPLLLVVGAAPPGIGAAAARWFSPPGKWAVGALAGSAVLQSTALVGDVPGLVGTGYGIVALGKLALLAVLLGFAWANRHRLAPALRGPGGAAARPALRRSIAVQAGFGLAVVLAAATLASLPPALHEQPLWPFATRPSRLALSEPELRPEILLGLLQAAFGAGLIGAAVLLRRRRMLAVAAVVAAVGAGATARPHLGLLLVEAYPTSYFASPTGFAATGIARGAGLFAAHCAACHGAGGRGDGPDAARLAVPPADLTAGHLWAHADGELFWWLAHGMDGPGGGTVMPGFADTLPPGDLWALIDYIRAHNAGQAFQEDGAWPVPVALPAFGMACPGGRTAWHDRALRLAVAPGGAVLVWPMGAAAPCETDDPAVTTALSVLSGIPADRLPGTQFLADADGWLRALARPDATGTTRWEDPAALRADLRSIQDRPLAAPGGGHHH